jgi:PilZ domain
MSSVWDTIKDNNRRYAPRHKARLSASVSLIEKETDESMWPNVLAYTRDISNGGLSLVVPSPHIGCHELNQGDHVLRIVLAISAQANVRITARLVHCTLFSQDESGIGYLIGVRIEEMNAADRVLYDEFISNFY